MSCNGLILTATSCLIKTEQHGKRVHNMWGT
jgi:hypothetical protein